MSDLITVLPSFDLAPQYDDLVAALEKHNVSVLDLLTLDASDVSTKTGVPLLELRRFSGIVNDALHADLGYGGGGKGEVKTKKENGLEVLKRQRLMTTADPEIDALLGGGLATGCITEIVGEAYKSLSHPL